MESKKEQLCVLELSKPEAVKRFKNAVLEGVNLESYSHMVTERVQERYSNDLTAVRYWGTKESGSKNIFTSISPNTTIIVILDKKVCYAMKVIDTICSPILNVFTNWGGSYPNIIFVEEPKPISIPYVELRKALGYEPGHWIGLKSVAAKSLHEALIRKNVDSISEWIEVLQT